MTTISVNNNVSSNISYSTKSSKQSEIRNLQQQRESLQQEIQSVQQTASTNGSSDETDIEIQALQAQISTIDSQIARLQSEQVEQTQQQSSTVEEYSKIESPLKELENPIAINNSLNKLGESTKMLEQSIALEKSRGLSTDDKDKVLENMRVNIEKLSEKLSNESNLENLSTMDIDLVGNFVNNKV